MEPTYDSLLGGYSVLVFLLSKEAKTLYKLYLSSLKPQHVLYLQVLRSGIAIS